MKRPSFQFYPSDWLRDTALRTCSVGARGLWIDMICYMHEGNPYGYLKVKNKVILSSNLAVMVGLTLQETEGYLKELFDAGVYEIDENGSIFSKRMVRDEKVRESRAKGGKLGGNPNLIKDKDNHKDNLEDNQKVENKDKQKSTPSSSSSSSSSIKEKNIKKENPDFDAFWKAYPRKTAKKNAEQAWKKVSTPIDTILNAIERQKKTQQWTKDNGAFIPHPATWLNQERWNDQLELKQENNLGKYV